NKGGSPGGAALDTGMELRMTQTIRVGRPRRAIALVGAMALVFTMLGVMQRPAQAAGWTISPTPLAFGQLRIGQVGIDRITITNNTGTSQTIHSVKTEGGTGPQDYFGITGLNSSFQGDPSQDCLFDSSHTPRTLADGESCSFFIIVSPTQV